MSDTQSNHFSDEDKYDVDSFDTLVAESSVYGSEDDLIDDDNAKAASQEPHSLPQSDYWPGGSSSDEDDVVLGQTIAEINTDPIEFDDESLSLTSAARVFKMASATRDEMIECEEFDDIEEDDDEILHCNGDIREDILDESTKLKERTEMLLTYEERILVETSGIEIDEEFTEIYDICDGGGEVDVGEPNIFEELADEDKEDEDKNEDEEDEDLFTDKDKDNDTGFLSDEVFEPGYDDEEFCDDNYYDDDEDDADTKTLEASSSVAHSLNEEMKSETKTLRTDDSMEEFKRKVMLSQRMRCVSDGAGDGAHIRPRKSSIPVWVGRDRFINSGGDSTKISYSEPGLRSMIPVPEVRKHGSQPDFSDADTLTPHDEDDDENNENEDDYMYEVCEQFSEYNASATSENAAICSYSMQLDMFTGPKETSTQRKKLKPNERRNKSFSNDRLRDIERHNNILLHKILNQKPTYVLDEKKKKKNNKFASLPPTTRVTSSEINRKKQQRQIDMDNQLLKRKLESIAKRKTKAKK